MIVERIGAGGLSTELPGSGQLGSQAAGGQLGAGQLSGGPWGAGQRGGGGQLGGQSRGGQSVAACRESGQAVRRGAARWPLAQRVGEKPLRIVAAGRLVADPQLDAGAVAQYQAVEAASGRSTGSGGDESGQFSDGAVVAGAGAMVLEPPALGGKVPAAGRAGRRPVRLTRRGRLVVLALLVLLLGTLAALVAIPSQAAAPAGPARVVVVQPGDSLWSIVERYRPGADPVRAMDELVAANDLSGSTVYPGEELVLPTQW